MKPRLFRKYIFSSVALMLVCLSIVLVITSFFLHGYIFEDRKKALNTSCLSTSVMLSGTKISDINALNQLHALNSDENIIIFANLEGYAIGGRPGFGISVQGLHNVDIVRHCVVEKG